MTDPLRLAEILCARFCHDFSGVLGSLMGAIELARDEPQANAEALSVGADAALVLAKRLRLLRAAGRAIAGRSRPRSSPHSVRGFPSASRSDWISRGWPPERCSRPRRPGWF